MKRSKKRKPVWLLTVASAYALMPAYGCELTVGDVTLPPDSGELDAGITVKPPDAGLPDAGRNDSDAGLIVRPPDASVDASSEVPGLVVQPPLDAGLDAAQIWVGLVARRQEE